jgi:uncharacterized protein
MTELEAITELTAEECWEMLRGEEFGRLAFRLVDEVHITPINYVAAGETLLFRTAEGSKLLGVAMGSQVALEIDRLEEKTARSVVVRGSTRLLPEDEVDAVDEMAQFSWVPTLKYNVVEVIPEKVTGRLFQLDRPTSRR